MIKNLFLAFLMLIVIGLQGAYAAAPKKDIELPPEWKILDLKPFVVNNIVNGKIAYTLNIAIRIEADNEATIKTEIARIRDNILDDLRNYLKAKTHYNQINYDEVKNVFERYFIRHYPNNVRKVLIFKIQVK